MPRQVDHSERRSLIAASFQALVAEHGLPAVTFARVAADARVSVGHIQHYFASKDVLLRFVFQDAMRARDDRLGFVIAEGDAAERPIRSILRTALLELLPLDDTRRREAHVTQAFRTRALHDRSLADVAVRADRDLHRRAAIGLTNGQLCGEVRTDTDPDAAAAQLLATTYGLAARLLLAQSTESTESTEGTDVRRTHEAVLDSVLIALLPGECHHYDQPVHGG